MNIHEAKTQFSKLVERAEAGEEIVIARNGAPVARLAPLAERPKRRPGSAQGQVWMAEDFDDALLAADAWRRLDPEDVGS